MVEGVAVTPGDILLASLIAGAVVFVGLFVVGLCRCAKSSDALPADKYVPPVCTHCCGSGVRIANREHQPCPKCGGTGRQ
jgi:DnaJ-class molecular chaperone